MTIKIVIADDHPVVRKGLSLLLSSQDEFEVIGEASNGEEAIAKALELSPEIMLMDLVMPKIDGISATKEILRLKPEIKILILTSFSDANHAIPALEAGALGYLLKENDPEEVIQAISKLVNGEKQIHPKVTEGLLSALQTQRKPEQNLLNSLTSREKEVLKEITNGKSNKEIASTLFISEKTVKTHVSNILSKLSLQDRTQAALFAIRHLPAQIDK
ncbi:DNA-binding response regulator [Pradoshia eiseniae]|uniref:DNA-binding response regulator n=1 Tax=Pradoshia eiseniae TaxID=2064768 RepID=A0A2S7MZ16_9BACI|nr:response regulator transcription factor [Pradoshia eiseniae]PQD95061.1 DNA-binding response regulator [Pradoshia eiseniae]